MSALDEKYEMDYIVYSASSTLAEERDTWHRDYVDVIKRMMFKKFDGWVEHKYINREKDGE